MMISFTLLELWFFTSILSGDRFIARIKDVFLFLYKKNWKSCICITQKIQKQISSSTVYKATFLKDRGLWVKGDQNKYESTYVGRLPMKFWHLISLPYLLSVVFPCFPSLHLSLTFYSYHLKAFWQQQVFFHPDMLSFFKALAYCWVKCGE